MRTGTLASHGTSADLIEFGNMYAASKRPRSDAATRRRAAQSSRPWANGSSTISPTCGIARNAGATQGSAATKIDSPRAASAASSGSAITASPIHCGAMTSERVMRFRSVRADRLAGLELVFGAAVRALARAGAHHVDEDAWMVAPERHLRIGAEDHARALQLGRGELHHGALSRIAACHRHHTLVSHSAYLGLRPLTMSKNALWIFSVAAARVPAPSSMRSSSRIGVTSAAVPVKKASSQM